MRLDQTTTLGFSFESEIGERSMDFEPTVIAMIDNRGRRLLVPVHRRRHQACAAKPSVATAEERDFISGTIH